MKVSISKTFPKDIFSLEMMKNIPFAFTPLEINKLLNSVKYFKAPFDECSLLNSFNNSTNKMLQ